MARQSHLVQRHAREVVDRGAEVVDRQIGCRGYRKLRRFGMCLAISVPTLSRSLTSPHRHFGETFRLIIELKRVVPSSTDFQKSLFCLMSDGMARPRWLFPLKEGGHPLFCFGLRPLSNQLVCRPTDTILINRMAKRL